MRGLTITTITVGALRAQAEVAGDRDRYPWSHWTPAERAQALSSGEREAGHGTLTRAEYRALYGV